MSQAWTCGTALHPAHCYILLLISALIWLDLYLTPKPWLEIEKDKILEPLLYGRGPQERQNSLGLSLISIFPVV